MVWSCSDRSGVYGLGKVRARNKLGVFKASSVLDGSVRSVLYSQLGGAFKACEKY